MWWSVWLRKPAYTSIWRVYIRLASSLSSSHASTSGSRTDSSVPGGSSPSACWRSNTMRRYSSHPMSKAPGVALDPLGLDLVRRVAGAGGEPEEERLVGRVGVGVLDEVDGAVGEVGVEVVARPPAAAGWRTEWLS